MKRDLMFLTTYKRFSIYCLQDIHITTQLETKVRNEWGSDVCFSSYQSNYRGRPTAILFSKDLEYKIHDTKIDGNGNFLAIDLELGSFRVTLISIYGLNEDNPHFFNNITKALDDFENAHSILCGDWNLVQDFDLDTFNYNRLNNPRSRDKLLDIKNSYNVIDPWRSSNPLTKRFTWRKKNPFKQSRLDFFLISQELLNLAQNTDILPGYRTDHSIITLTLSFSDINKGKSYWKFNNSLLKDPEYVQTIKKQIYEQKRRYSASPYTIKGIKNTSNQDLHIGIFDQLFFEMLLMEFRGATIQYSSQKKKMNINREKALEKYIFHLEQKVSSGHNPEQAIVEDLYIA
jgi:exonuclease III